MSLRPRQHQSRRDAPWMPRAVDLPTKRSAVEFALRRLLESRLTDAALDAMLGVGWEGDLESLRTDE